jgi:hypothetical protein
MTHVKTLILEIKIPLLAALTFPLQKGGLRGISSFYCEIAIYKSINLTIIFFVKVSRVLKFNIFFITVLRKNLHFYEYRF